jgi:hypothetical protein
MSKKYQNFAHQRLKTKEKKIVRMKTSDFILQG